ncbi:hypothetical protein fugu_014495 [Takifugu bimaculatus]|uniref:W2 domain-containing protein n=1 Tax=Takifugu bimaculatus TaxID=433685 RepID=A0A4Z2C1F3_9TELE|nr:hypothetical protein fugu_014495 [Takifugu bimaculatus]
MPSAAPRVQTSNGPRPVGPAHVYPSSSQMMMISQQQLSFAGSPQGYFLPGQYRAPFMPPTQQYPVTSGTASFYPGTSPAEYPPYAGAYYPAQPQYSPSVQPAPVMISPAQQQQQAPPPQQPPAQPQGPPKRERKPIRIRDPNQGGRDITEEIMSGGRSATTPTPPQHHVGAENPPPPPTENPEALLEAYQAAEPPHAPPPELAAHPLADAAEVPPPLIKDEQATPSLPPPTAAATPPPEAESQVEAKVSDTVDAPVVPSESLAKKEAPVKMEELDSSSDEKTPEKDESRLEEVKKVEEDVVPSKVGVAVEDAALVNPVNPAAQHPAAQHPAAQPSELPPSEQEPAAPQNQSATLSPELEPEPTLVEAPELPLANGLPRDTEELPELSFSDTTPLEKPDNAHSQEPAPVAQTATQEEAVKEEDGLKPSRDDPPAAVCPPTEEPTTMQPATSVPKKRKNMKELNKKEAIGDLLDAFTEEQIKPAAEALSTQASPVLDAQEESSPSEAADETWEEKEDKHSGESDGPKPAPDPAGQKHQSKEEEEKSNDQDDKKRYNRDFLLGRQFLGASMHRPEGLPSISDVVLDKVNKTPLRPADPARLMNVGPDFTPSYLGNLGSRSVGGPRGPLRVNTEKPGATVNFRKLLLNRCQKEFERDQDDDEIFERKQKELDAAKAPGAVDVNNQLLAPGGKGTWGSWGKGSSGGSGAKPASGEQDSNRPATSTLNRFSALQQSGSLLSSADSDRRAPPHRSSSSRERDRVDRDRFDRFDRNEGRQGRDDRGGQTRLTKRSFSRESQDRGSRGRDSRDANEPVRRVASMTDSRDRGSRDRGSRDRGSADRRPGKELAVKGENAPTPPPPKPAMTEEEVEKKAKAIIEEYLHINDSKEALQCVTELNSASQLFVFVRCGVESTLERSTLAREHMGRLLHNLVKDGILATQQYYRGLEETLEAAEDIAIDIPHIWLYLAELITPMLHEGGIPMGQLFREISKPLVPLGKAAVLLVKILKLLCKGMTPKKVGAMWVGAGLNWNDFLPEDQDMNKFVTEQEVEFTLGEETESAEVGKKVLSGAELSKELDQLLEDDASNQRITDWVEANLDEAQVASNQFIRALMTCVCQSAIVCVNTYKVNPHQINKRAALLQKYLCDEQKELQALFALQALMVHMEQPANLLRMFFDALYDEDVIKEEAFYKWESSKDPAEQTGKGVALKSVTAFFTWLREAEDESDKE